MQKYEIWIFFFVVWRKLIRILGIMWGLYLLHESLSYVLQTACIIAHRMRSFQVFLSLFITNVYNTAHSSCAGPSSHAVWGVGLRPLTCWDCGFESHPGHGCLSVVSVVCCKVEVSATDWSVVQRSPTECGASLCVIKKPSILRKLKPATRLWKYNHNGL